MRLRSIIRAEQTLILVECSNNKLVQHLEYLKPPFLDTCEWAIRPVFPDTVTYALYGRSEMIMSIPIWHN